MPTYAAPGVYVEIVKTAPPIQPAGTSTAGFMGRVSDDVDMPDRPVPKNGQAKYPVAPAQKPVLLTSFDQFVINFGAPQGTGTAATKENLILAHAVFGFFQNGGTRCYVARTNAALDNTGITAILKNFEAVDEISLVAAPGVTTKALTDLLIGHCQKMKYRFAVIDGNKTAADFQLGSVTDQVQSANNNYGAVYFPWITVVNQVAKPPQGQEMITVPPCGHILGLIAKVDQRAGTHYSPANEVLVGAQSLAYNLSKSDQEGLNPKGVNLIRSFKGAIKVWGARTLADPAGDTGSFIYINVQRTMSFIAQSIDEGTQFVVFKPNNQKLWAQIKRALTGFLTNVWRDGALFGTQPEQAFFIRVDETNNPPDVRELGQVIIEVGVSIVLPAEFVIFRIQQFTQIPTT
jgi:phage tail sheath protein FI